MADSVEDLIRRRDTVPRATVARGLMEHQDWYVPAAVARAAGVGHAPLESLPQGGVLEGTLAVFTARERVRLFSLGGPGGYIGGVPGHRLFSSLDDRLDSVEINPLGPRDAQMSIPREAFPGLRLWALGVGFEARLAGTGRQSREQILHRYRLMRGFGHYLVVTWKPPEGGVRVFPLEVPDLPGVRFALAFSTLDRLDACLASLPPDMRGALDVGSPIGGEPLFRGLARDGLGVFLNLGAPEPEISDMVVPTLWETVLSAA